MYEPIENDETTSDELMARWFWIATPEGFPSSIIAFAKDDPDATRRAISEFKRKYNITLTDGWNGD